MVGVGEGAVVEDFPGVGEVVVGAGVEVVVAEVQEEDILEVGGVGAFEVVDPEEVLGAEEGAEDEVVFVDHSTLASVNLQYICLWSKFSEASLVQRPKDCTSAAVTRSRSARSFWRVLA